MFGGTIPPAERRTKGPKGPREAALSHDCHDGGFPLLLARHYRERATGALEVSAGGVRKKVFLQDGRVVFAGSTDRNDRLGEMLIRRGILSVPDFYAASSSVTPGKRFGTVLVERGLITPDQLVWSVKEQVKDIVFSLFSLPDGDCAFVQGEDAGEEMITLNLRTPELLRLGVLKMDHTVRPLQAFRETNRAVGLSVPEEEVLDAFDLGQSERALVLSLLKPRSVAAVFREAGRSQFALLKFLWVLLLLDMIRLEPGGQDPDGASADMPELDVTLEDLADLG